MRGCPHDLAVHAMTVTVPQTTFKGTARSCEYPFRSFGVGTSQQKTTPAACSARSPLDRHAAGNCRSSFFFCGSPLHRHASNRSLLIDFFSCGSLMHASENCRCFFCFQVAATAARVRIILPLLILFFLAGRWCVRKVVPLFFLFPQVAARPARVQNFLLRLRPPP